MSQLPYLLQQAEQSMMDGDWEKAQQLYQQARDLDSKNPKANQGLSNVQKAVEKEAVIRERIAEAEALFAQGDYQGAAREYVAIIDYAVVAPPQSILKFHPRLEQGRNQAKDLHVWQERAAKALSEARRSSDAGDWESAAQAAEALLLQLPQDPAYQPLKNELESARTAALSQGNDKELLRKAEEFLRVKDYAQGITLLENISENSPSYPTAQPWLKQVRGYLEKQKRDLAAVETAIAESRWTDALAQLEQWRGSYQDVQLWQQLYLKAGMTYGRLLLEVGRQQNQQRAFDPARRQFESAQTAFEKILEIYPTHLDAQTLRDESVDLVAITTHQAQAQADWDNGRREDAAQALKLAQQRLAHAKSEGRDYTAVGAVVETMHNTVQAEVERIREDERRLRNAESLWENNRLSEARQHFEETLNALLPEHQRQAAEGLRRVEAKIQQFEALLKRAEALNDPIAATAVYQDAYTLWPDGPGVTRALETSLVRACETALNAGRETEAVGYGDRALVFNPDNREAKECVAKAGAKPQVEATLARVRNEWAALQQQETLQFAALDPLIQDLEAALRKVAEWPDLRQDLEALHKTLRDARALWQDYDQTYTRAAQLRDKGEWTAALTALEQAIAALGDAVPAGARKQLSVWRNTVETLEQARRYVDAAWEKAQEAYTAAAASDALSDIADALDDAALRHVEPARKRLDDAEEQVRNAGGLLPTDLATSQKQLKDLDERAIAAADAARDLSASGGLLKIQEVIKMRGSDPTLEAARAQLESKARDRINSIKIEALTAIQAGDLTEAEEKLRQVRELDPGDKETAGHYAEIHQRRVLEEKLRSVEREAGDKLAGNSPVDAMKTLRQGVNELLKPDVNLPPQVREILNELTTMGDRDDGLALGQPDNWQTAQDRLAVLGNLRQENWAAGRAVVLVDQWIRLARDNALRGVVASAAQLGNLIESYRAAAAYIKAHPTEALAIETLTARTEALIHRANEAANKRVQRAQSALESGEFQSALNNLQDIEQDFYHQIDQEFPGLLDGQDEVQKVRDTVAGLQEKAQKLQSLNALARPIIEQARQAYLMGEWDAADKALETLPSLKELPDLDAEVKMLRAQIANARVEATRKTLHEVMSQIETGRHLATTTEQLNDYLDKLDKLQKEINLQVLDVGERNRYFQVLGEVRDQRETLIAGEVWEQKIEAYVQQQNYTGALMAIHKTLDAIHDAHKKVSLEMRRDEIEKLAQTQSEREAALKQGRDAFDAESYSEARQHFEKAGRLGADVAELLRAARAGAKLQSARRMWDEMHDSTSALADLDELAHFAEENPHAERIADDARYLRHRIETARKDTLEVQHALAEANRLLLEGQFKAAQDSVQKILERAPASKDALALQAQIREQSIAQDMLEKARAAQQVGKYKEALQLVETVLEKQPDNPEARLLQRQIGSVINADKAFLQVETLAKQSQFKAAREKLTELSSQGGDPEKLRQVQQLVDDLEKEQWTRVIHPIQELYRDGEYAEAWNRCKQASGRTAAPELLDELQTLQNSIVNRWAEKQAQAARAQLQKRLEQEQLRDLEAQLKPFLVLDPPPDGHWVRQFEDLLRETRTRRLRARLGQARERYDEWRADALRGAPQAALDIIKAVQEEAEVLGTQVEFDITLDAASLSAEIQDALRERDADSRRAEREQWMDKTRALQAQLEDADYIARKSPGRVELERIAEWANQVFKIPGFENDGQARELVAWARNALEAFDRTQKALEEAQRLARLRRFRDAEYELRGAGVSLLLKTAHERQREVASGLHRAEDHQNNEAWDLALQEYRQALALDPNLESFLEKEMERCYQRLRERVSATVEQALNQTSPDTTTARAALTQAETAGWITPLGSRDYDRLRNWLDSQEYVAQAATLLQAQDGDPTEAHKALQEARRSLPQEQSDEAICQWESLVEALLAWDAYQRQPVLLPGALDTFRKLQPPIANLARVQALRQQLEDETKRRHIQAEQEAEQRRLQEAEAAEREELLATLENKIGETLATPRDYTGAVQALESASPKIKGESAFAKQCTRVKDDLCTAMDGAIKELRYAQALEWAEILKRLPELDQATRDWATGLPSARRDAFNARLQAAEAALQRFEEQGVLSALADAEIIIAPEGDRDRRIADVRARLRDARLNIAIAEAEKALEAYDPAAAETAIEKAKKIPAAPGDARLDALSDRLSALRALLERIHSGLREVGGLMGQKQWSAAVERLKAVRGEAPDYPRVVSAVDDLQERMKAQAESQRKAGEFAHGLELCDLALSLDTCADLRALQQQIRDEQEVALTKLRQKIQEGLDTWRLGPLPGLLGQGFKIAKNDVDLLKLQDRFKIVEALLPELGRAMNQGWDALMSRDYPTAIAAFSQTLSLASHFAEGQVWGDYTQAMQKAADAMLTTTNFVSGASLLTQAEKVLRMTPGQLLPDILISEDHLQKRRRDALYNAWLLRQSARKIADLYAQSNAYKAKRTADAMRQAIELAKRAAEEQKSFAQHHASPSASPDNFPLGGMLDDEPQPTTLGRSSEQGEPQRPYTPPAAPAPEPEPEEAEVAPIGAESPEVHRQTPPSTTVPVMPPHKREKEPVPNSKTSVRTTTSTDSATKPGMRGTETPSPPSKQASPEPPTKIEPEPPTKDEPEPAEDEPVSSGFGAGWGSGFWANSDSYANDEETQ